MSLSSGPAATTGWGVVQAPLIQTSSVGDNLVPASVNNCYTMVFQLFCQHLNQRNYCMDNVTWAACFRGGAHYTARDSRPNFPASIDTKSVCRKTSGLDGLS